MKKTMNYGISYAPPLAVKDEPHRTLDTLDGWNGELDLRSEDFGQLCEVGQIYEFESEEISNDRAESD